MNGSQQDAVAALLGELRPPRRAAFSVDTFTYRGLDTSCAFCRREAGLTWETFDEPDARAGQGFWRVAREGEPVPDRVTDDVERWDETIAFRPLTPVTPNHVLVVPRLHVPDHTHGAALAVTMIRAAELARGLEWAGWDTNIISSSGGSASQTIWHLHVHVIPRTPGDGLMLPWTVSE